MKIKCLHLCNYRNIDEVTVNFGENLNIIYGANGQGKTNLLEAVYLLALLSSHRTGKESELIKFTQENCRIEGEFVRKFLPVSSSGNNQLDIKTGAETELREEKLDLSISLQKLHYGKINRELYKDDLPVGKSADFIGNFNAVLFAPEDLLLIKSAPQQRRQFINRILAQSKKIYLYNLQKFNRVLLGRNRLLKELQLLDRFEVLQIYRDLTADLFSENKPINIQEYWQNLLQNSSESENDKKEIIRQKISLLQAIDVKFADLAANIMQDRAELLRDFNEPIRKFQEKLSDGKEKLTIKYVTDGENPQNNALETIKEKLIAKIRQNFSNDLHKGYTSVGPQKDDVEFYLNEKNCRLFASQGQQRTVILSLKLAECDYLRTKTYQTPVLLLDDVLSELDERRKAALCASVADLQVLLTCTDLELLNKNWLHKQNVSYYHVENGKILQAKEETSL